MTSQSNEDKIYASLIIDSSHYQSLSLLYESFYNIDDMVQASLFVLELDEQMYKANTQPPMMSHINIGTGKNITIREMAEIMSQVVGYEGKLTFDASKPDGLLCK